MSHSPSPRSCIRRPREPRGPTAKALQKEALAAISFSLPSSSRTGAFDDATRAAARLRASWGTADGRAAMMALSRPGRLAERKPCRGPQTLDAKSLNGRQARLLVLL